MNFFKTNFLALFVVLCSAMAAHAQQPERNAADLKKRIDAWRVSFITQQLELTPAEAEKFWPVYNQYRKELEQILDAVLGDDRFDDRLHPPHKDMEGMSDQEVEKILMDEMDKQQKILDLRKNYYQKFKAVLPIKKVAQLYLAEKDFQRQLIHRITKHSRENQ